MAKSNRLLSASEIQKHNTADNVWIVVEGKVYDMSRFAPEHPGGAESENSFV